jgi:drug/metabolite transporter (DMT)-like permease
MVVSRQVDWLVFKYSVNGVYQLNDRMKGMFITLLAITFLSPDTLMFRLLGQLGTSTSDILFWRGILVAIGVLIFLKINRAPVLDSIRKSFKYGFLIIIFDTASNIFFYSALSLTTAANTLIILSSVPLFAAVLGQLFLADAVKIRTWIAMGVVTIAVVLLASGSQQSGRLIGDLLALGAALSIAISLVTARKCRAFDMTPCVGIANLLTSLVVLPLASPMLIPGGGSAIILLLCMGLFSTFAMISLIVAPRYINAAEASLFLPLETVLGSFLVWYFIGEPIKNQTFIGGALILGSVLLYTLCEFRENRRVQRVMT